MVVSAMSKDFPNSREQLTPEQRRQRDAQRKADAADALADYEKAQKAFRANHERLKADTAFAKLDFRDALRPERYIGAT